MPLTPDVGLQAGSDIVGSLINWGATAQQNKKNRQFAEQMAEKEWKRNLDMWNMQNAYNTPSAQMKRFKDAGLNPHLIYGKGTSGNSSTLPNYNAPKWQGTPPQIAVPNMVAMYNDLKRTKIMDDATQAKIEVDKERANQVGLQNAIKAIQLSYAPQNEKYQMQAKENLVKMGLQKIKNLAQTYNVNQAKLDYEMWRYKYIKKNEYSPEGSFNVFKQMFKGARMLPSLYDAWNKFGEKRKSW